MIGTRLRRRRDKAAFRVVGRDGGQWVLGPEAFGSAISVSELEAREWFAVVGEPVESPIPEPTVTVAGRSADDQAGYEALAEQAIDRFAASLEPSASSELSPEQIFRKLDSDAAA